MSDDKIKGRFQQTMQEIAAQIEENSILVNSDQIITLINYILQIKKEDNRIFVYGAGRSGFIGRCFAQRLMHLGINSCFISDAVTPQYTNKDLLILISGSGETTSPAAIAKKAKEIKGRVVLFTGNPESTIGKLSDLNIIVKGKRKDLAIQQKSLAPYTSLFDISTLSVLDSIGGVLMNILGITESDINRRHASIE